jgi:hypothetical protein
MENASPLCSTAAKTDRNFSICSLAWIFIPIHTSPWTTLLSANPLLNATVCASVYRRACTSQWIRAAQSLIRGYATGCRNGGGCRGQRSVSVSGMYRGMRQVFTSYPTAVVGRPLSTYWNLLSYSSVIAAKSASRHYAKKMKMESGAWIAASACT